MNINDLIINQIVPQIKQPIWDSWYIKEKIGAGGFSVVYRVEAQRTSMTDEAALKIGAIVTDRPFSDPDKKKSFLDKQKISAENETVIMKKLRDCPYIVRYEDEKTESFCIDGVFEGYYSLIRMELLTPIDRLMYKQQFSYSEENVTRLAREIGQALQFAHRNGIIHRDLKPENIFISKSGTYKLGDFNISKKAVSTHSFAGSNYYMAPEILKVASDADESYTNQADIYSFGIVLYQMMNGGLFPLETEDVSVMEATDRRMKGEVLPPPVNASEKLSRIILKACAFDTKDRYASMDEMLADLNRSEQMYTSAPAPAPRPEPAPDPNKTVYVAAEEPIDSDATIYIPASDNAPKNGTKNGGNKLMKAVIAGAAAIVVIAGAIAIPNIINREDDISTVESSAEEREETDTEPESEESSETTSETTVPETAEQAAVETSVPTETETVPTTASTLPEETTDSETTTTPKATTTAKTTTTPKSTTTAKTTTTPKATTTAKTTTTPKVTTTAATTTTPKVTTTAATTTTPKVTTTAATTTTPKVTTAKTTKTTKKKTEAASSNEYIYAKGDFPAVKKDKYYTVDPGTFNYDQMELELFFIDEDDDCLVSLGLVDDALSGTRLINSHKRDSDGSIVLRFDNKWLCFDGYTVPIYDIDSHEVAVPCRYGNNNDYIYWVYYYLVPKEGTASFKLMWNSNTDKYYDDLFDRAHCEFWHDVYNKNGVYDHTESYYISEDWELTNKTKVAIEELHGEYVFRYVFSKGNNKKYSDLIYRKIQ